jgi:hypothetical protein
MIEMRRRQLGFDDGLIAAEACNEFTSSNHKANIRSVNHRTAYHNFSAQDVASHKPAPPAAPSRIGRPLARRSSGCGRGSGQGGAGNQNHVVPTISTMVETSRPGLNAGRRHEAEPAHGCEHEGMEGNRAQAGR